MFEYYSLIEVDSFFDFCDCYTFCIKLRPIFVDFILKKYDNTEKIFLEYDRILMMILREYNKFDLYDKLKHFLPNSSQSKYKIEEFITNFEFLKNEPKSLLYYTLFNFFILLHFFDSNNYTDVKKCLEFILNMINLISKNQI